MYDLIIPEHYLEENIEAMLKNLERQMYDITGIPKSRENPPRPSLFRNGLVKNNNNIIWCGHEWQCCMEGYRLINTLNPYQWYSEHCVRILDSGTLVLTMEKDPRQIKHWDGEIYNPEYGVGTLRSVEAYSYGTFKAKVMLPKGKGLWPSFWLTCKETHLEFEYERKFRGQSLWPAGGEIDAPEGWSRNDKYFTMFIAQPPYVCPSWRISTTNIHYAENGKHASIGTRNIPWCKQHKSPVDNYIEYEIEWLPDKITIKANGKIVRQDTKSAIAITNHWKSIGQKPGMAVIFNVWIEDPAYNDVSIYNDMYVKDFEYLPMP